MHNPFKGQTPFPLAGEGAVLRFTTGDITALRGKYGAPPTRKPELDERGQLIDHFWTILLTGISTHDPVIMVDVLKAGLKHEDGKKPLKLDWTDLPFSFRDMEEPLQEGLYLSRWGMTSKELAAHLKEEAERFARENGGEEVPQNPTTDPTPTNLQTSDLSEQPTASASE